MKTSQPEPIGYCHNNELTSATLKLKKDTILKGLTAQRSITKAVLLLIHLS